MTDEIKEQSPELRRKELAQETENLLTAINTATGVNFNDATQYWDTIDQGLNEHVYEIGPINNALSQGNSVSYRPISALLQASNEQQLENIVGLVKGAISSSVRDQEIENQINEKDKDTVIRWGNDVTVNLNRDNILTAVVPNKQGTVDIVTVDEKYFSPLKRKALNYKVAERFLIHDLDLRRATQPSSAPKTTQGK